MNRSGLFWKLCKHFRRNRSTSAFVPPSLCSSRTCCCCCCRHHHHRLCPRLTHIPWPCQAPVLDMLGYTSLSAGPSVVAEYGDPADPTMRKALLQYSPYHNLDRAQTYPHAFFTTNIMDDRVHPGHARKMVAKMLAMGKPVYYIESPVGVSDHPPSCRGPPGGYPEGVGVPPLPHSSSGE